MSGAYAASFLLAFGFAPFIVEAWMPDKRRDPGVPRCLRWVLPTVALLPIAHAWANL